MYNNQHMNQQYKAYATASMTVGKVRQVVMLYDGSIRFVQQAMEAIQREDYEARYNLLVKATQIIEGLQNSLDFENGGEISQLLYDYYASIDARLFAVHRSNDVKVLESILKELRNMRDVWNGIDQGDAEKKQTAHEAESAAMPHTPGTAEYNSIGVSA